MLSGDEWKISGLGFSGGEPENSSSDPFDIWLSLQMNAGALQYWVAHSRLQTSGFAQADYRVTLTCPRGELCPIGTVYDDVTLSFHCESLSLTTELDRVRSYVPVKAVPVEPFTPTWALTVAWVDGASDSLQLSELEFARFPYYCWSGWYSYWPFFWYRDVALGITQTNGSNIDVPLDQLSRIEFPERCLDANCACRLVYTDGHTLEALIYPGSTNQDTKKGPSRWAANQEGLLGRAAPGVLVFLPFSEIESVDLRPLSAPTAGP